MAALIGGSASAVTLGNAVKHDETPLSTKFIPPVEGRTLVARARLYETLDRAVQQRLTLLSAAPGFGKTTLLAAWCAGHPEQPAAWVTLDSRENDPIRFLRSCILALDKTYPGLGVLPLALMNSRAAPHRVSIETVLVALTNAIVASEGEIILILDDYQVIHAQSVHDTLSFLLEHASSALHMIIGSRADPPLPLMRLRAKGQLMEIRASDLQFDSGETLQFLKETMGLPLSTAQVETLHRRTEGWITGLLLAALSIAGSPDIATFLESFSGMDRSIFDYLVSELLEQQSSGMQQFLLHTSVLERLCAPLAEALTGDPNAQSVLEHLERANLFLVPLDHQRRWYRYHPLFADVLKARLTQQFPTHVTDLHRRAALWYASQLCWLLSTAGHKFVAPSAGKERRARSLPQE
jgi:LuxR family transcriptional regulator, maltose regulon positive regulatory protein